MPYLLLALGLIIGIYALMKFFMRANPSQIKALILAIFTTAIAIGLLFLAVTGKLPAAIAALGALIPFIINFVRSRGAQSKTPSQNTEMTRDEALKILNLNKDADKKQIKEAYKKLMKKVHPDQEGSEWMATKLNEAKEFLLKDKP